MRTLSFCARILAFATATVVPTVTTTPLAAQAGDSDADPPIGAAVSSAAPVVDGRLDDPAWVDAPVLDGFVQAEPSEGSPASERTEIRVVFDAEALYVGAWMFDSDPTAVVFGETRRDADPETSDAIVLLIDTFLDRQNGFVFGTTPAGIEYDGQVTREGQGGSGGTRRTQTGSGGGFNLNWDGNWDVATHRDDAGWYAEFRIPFSTLRYERGGLQRWGFNVSRRIRRRNEESFWAPIPRQYSIFRVSQAGTLDGIEAPQARTLQLTPFVLMSTTRDYTVSSEFDSDADFGGDAKVGLTPGLTLDLTVNTDFAQVEVDDQQVNLTRFDLFFPEKRPFFLENAGTFSVGTPQEAEIFFSRRIGISGGEAVPIDAGGRVTGKVGGFTVGLLDIQTAEVDGVAAPNNYAVVRALRELPNRSRVGATAVTRFNTDDTSDRNLTYALDGRLGIADNWAFDGYAAVTRTPASRAESLGLAGDGRNHAFQVGGNYDSRDWGLGASFREVGGDFNPEVGFLPRTSYRFTSVRVLRKVRFEGVPWFRELRPHISYREHRDFGGLVETGLLHIDSHFEFSNGAFFQLPAINYTKEGLREPFEIANGVVVPAGSYGNWDWGFAFNTDLSAPLSFRGRIDIGGFYTGTRYGAAPELAVRWADRAVASLRVSYFDVNLPEGDFERTIVGLRTAYSFSPRIFLQSLIQYNDQNRRLSSNVRLGWLNTAGTGLFLVYNDVEQRGLLDESGDPLRSTGGLHPTDRTFVIKFTRLIDLGR